MTLLDKYTAYVSAYNWYEPFVKFSFITCVSAVLSRSVWLYNDGLGYTYPNIYTLLVGSPASMKTTAANRAFRYIQDMHRGPLIAPKRMTPAAFVKIMQEANSQCGDEDQSPVFIYAKEFQLFFNDIGGGTIVDMMLDLYDPMHPGEVWTNYIVKEGKKSEIVNPSITVLGCTTPAFLQECKFATQADTGLVSRFIVVSCNEVVEGTKHFPTLDPCVHKDIVANFNRMSQLRGEFKFSPEAQKIDHEIFDEINAWKHQNPGTTLKGAYYVRKRVQVQKLAMCFSAMRGNDMVISEDDIKNARALFDSTSENFTEAFGRQIKYRDANLMNKIFSRIPPGGIEEQRLLRTFEDDGQAIPDGYEFRDAVRGLTRSGRLRIESRGEDLIYHRGKAYA